MTTNSIFTLPQSVLTPRSATARTNRPNSRNQPRTESTAPQVVVNFSRIERENSDPPCELREKLEEMRRQIDALAQKFEASQNEVDGKAEAMRIKLKLLKIATRIMSGDDVPIKDQKFLAEHDIEMFKMAVSLRRYKEDPEEHDRLSEDEDTTEGITVAENPAKAFCAPHVPPAETAVAE